MRHYAAYGSNLDDEQMRAACANGTRVWCDTTGILPPPDPPSTDTGDTGGEGEGDVKADQEGAAQDQVGHKQLESFQPVGLAVDEHEARHDHADDDAERRQDGAERVGLDRAQRDDDRLEDQHGYGLAVPVVPVVVPWA